MIMRRYYGLATLVLIVAACATGEVSDEATPSTQALVSTTTPATTTTTVVATTIADASEANLATAETLNKAIYDGDEEAVNDLPWANPGGPAHNDASDLSVRTERRS